MKLDLKKPHITEKSMSAAQNSVYTFKVSTDSTKGGIKEAIEKAFGVEVTKVRTQTIKPLTDRSGRTGHYQTKPAFKKALVSLKKGQTIKYFSQN